MGKNVKLVPQATAEDDERLLEDTLFPFVYCNPAGDAGSHLPDLEQDIETIKGGDRKIVARNARRCEDILLWLQAIGTPCGYHHFQSLQAQAKLLQSACLRVVSHHEDFEFALPLLPWLKSNLAAWTAKVKAGDPDAVPLEIMIKSLRTWISLDKALGVLSGESELTLRVARNHLALLDKWIGGTVDLAMSLPEGASPEDPACPLEAGLPLGTRTLARSASKAAAYLYLFRLEEAAKAKDVDFDGTAYYQGSPFQLRTLALYDKKLVGRRPPNEAAIMTFLAASDLAMFTPMHPIFAHLRTGLRWDSLHPGLRLQQILGVIKRKNLVFESKEAKDYFNFTSRICVELDWPEVPRFLDAGRKLEADGANEPVKEMFKLACEQREEHPTAFFDPILSVTDLPSLALPGTQLANFDTNPDADRALSFAMEAEIFALGFQALYSDREPEFVCNPLKGVLEQFETPRELIKSYYGLEL